MDLTGPAGDVEAVNMLRMLAIKAKRFNEQRHELRRLWGLIGLMWIVPKCWQR